MHYDEPDADKKSRRRDYTFVMQTTNETRAKWGDIYPDPIFYDREFMKYLTYGKEVGGKTKHPHFQGYVSFNQGYSPKRAREIFQMEQRNSGDKKWMLGFRVRKGTQDEAINYAQKDNDFIEDGERPEPGKSQALKTIATKLRTGITVGDILRQTDEFDDTIIRHHSGLKSFEAALNNDQVLRDMPKVYILTGESGTGKTGMAWHHSTNNHPDWRKFIIPQITGNGGMGWFNGYDHHEVLIYDNIDHGWTYDWGFLMRLLDRYPIMLPTKGGMVSGNNIKAVYMTSVHEPDRWIGSETKDGMWVSRDITELKRRITFQWHITKPPEADSWKIIQVNGRGYDLETNEWEEFLDPEDPVVNINQ